MIAKDLIEIKLESRLLLRVQVCVAELHKCAREAISFELALNWPIQCSRTIYQGATKRLTVFPERYLRNRSDEMENEICMGVGKIDFLLLKPHRTGKLYELSVETHLSHNLDMFLTKLLDYFTSKVILAKL